MISMRINNFFISAAFFLLIIGFAVPYRNAWAGDDLDKIVQSIGGSIQKAGKKTIAVVDFADLQGNITELGRYLAEEFSVRLAGADKGFEVVDRTHLKTILMENKLSSTGLIDPATARKLGQIIGVESLITGTITPFGESVRLAVKILDTSTAKIVGASSAEIAKTRGIEELLSRGIDNSSISSGPGGTSTIKPSANSKAIRSESNGFDFEVKSCKKTGSTIVCEILVTNKISEDREMIVNVHNFDPYLRVITNDGITYIPSNAELGGKSSNSSVRTLLVSGIPTVLIITVEGVKPNFDFVALIDIRYEFVRNTNWTWGQGQLRNVPLQK